MVAKPRCRSLEAAQALGTDFIAMVKDSSLVAVLYLMLTVTLWLLLRRLERM